MRKRRGQSKEFGFVAWSSGAFGASEQESVAFLIRLAHTAVGWKEGECVWRGRYWLELRAI